MTSRFREFIRQHPFVVSLFEDEAAPAMGTNSGVPENPDVSGNSHHFDAVKNQMGMEDDDFDSAMSTGSITIWKSQDFSSKWGFVVSGSIQADVNKRPDGMYNVLFHLKDKKLMMPKSFILPYKQGQQPINYKGPIEDKTEVMTAEELQDAMTAPFENGGLPPEAAGGMGGGPMGGGGMGGMEGGPMGGGMGGSPMGGPAGDSMGGPPMGGGGL